MDSIYAEAVELIEDDSELIAVVIKAAFEPSRTQFVTQVDAEQQIGFIVYRAGGTINPHEHRPMPRQIETTSETLVVRRGKLEAALYNRHRELVASRLLEAGDVLVLVSGGHGFRMKEDTVLLEVKQGPYFGMKEKQVWTEHTS